MNEYYFFGISEDGVPGGTHFFPMDETEGIKESGEQAPRSELEKLGVFIEKTRYDHAEANTPEGHSLRWKCDVKNQAAEAEYYVPPYVPQPSPLVEVRCAIAFALRIEDEEELNDQVTEIAAAHHFVDPTVQGRWNPGAYISAGTEIYYEPTDTKYKALVHLTMTDIYPPDKTPTLYAEVRAGWAEWKQPLGAHDAYQPGDGVLYKGAKWVNDQPNNVYAPDVWGWHQHEK